MYRIINLNITAMKKKLLLFALALLPLTGFAQLNINSKGQTVLGTRAMNIGIVNGPEKIITPPDPGFGLVEVDSVAKLVVLGKGTFNTNGYISFGAGTDVAIGEMGSTSFDNMLTMKGSKGLQFNLGNKRYFYARCSEPSSTDMIFLCSLKANAFNVASDIRLKKDVESLDDAWTRLGGINSIAYTLKPKPVADAEDGEEVIEDAVPDDRRHFGFSAQEVREVYPELVSEDSEGWLSIDYIGFIPILVDAVKNLQAKNDELTEEIARIQNGAQSFRVAEAGVGQAIEGIVTPSLGQNRPNPFSESTVIEITLPETVGEAALYIYDMQGTQKMRLDVEGRGNTSVTVDSRTLGAGMYLYSLIADGEEIATKRMIITD